MGNLTRIVFQEMYRVPVTVPFDKYEEYFKALETWFDMVHSSEFEMRTPIEKGELIVMNNWRIMHGRAGLKGQSRVILGGEVTRDAFLSKVREYYQDRYQ